MVIFVPKMNPPVNDRQLRCNSVAGEGILPATSGAEQGLSLKTSDLIITKSYLMGPSIRFRHATDDLDLPSEVASSQS